VLLAGPATLIGLLRAVHVGFNEEKLAAEAQELRRLGVEFRERAGLAFGHIASVGELLEKTVNKYNEFVGSYRSRLEPTLKRFEADGGKREQETPTEVTVRVRELGTAGTTPTLIDVE
jgi:DNA recombination protein RmuC